MAEIGDKYVEVCPFCNSSSIKYWGGSTNDKMEWEDNYTCRDCLRTFIVKKERIVYMEGVND